MKKIAVLGFLLFSIISNVFADEEIKKFDNVYFPWQFCSHFNENSQKINFFIGLNQNLLTQSNLIINYNPIPQFRELFEPIGPVTSMFWLFLFADAMVEYANDWKEYSINNPNPIHINRSWHDEWNQQWRREIELDRETLRERY